MELCKKKVGVRYTLAFLVWYCPNNMRYFLHQIHKIWCISLIRLLYSSTSTMQRLEISTLQKLEISTLNIMGITQKQKKQTLSFFLSVVTQKYFLLQTKVGFPSFWIIHFHITSQSFQNILIWCVTLNEKHLLLLPVLSYSEMLSIFNHLSYHYK